jgi:hypothetical protein
MRRIVLFLMVLFMTVPAVADVDITATDDDVNEVVITYVTDGNLVRAFGLDITLDGANITKVVAMDPCYRIYPGQIVIEDGVVTDQGTPYATADLGDANVAIEMGSLYTMDSNYAGDSNAGYNMKPGTSGTLLKFYVDGGCLYDVNTNALRGGIVMENPDEVPNVYFHFDDGNFPSCYTGPQPAEWASVGSPQCWCASVNPRQCYGDVDNRAQAKQNYWVYTYDSTVFNAAWQKPYADMIDANGVHLTTTVGGVAVPWICADLDHLPGGKKNYRGYTADSSIFLANWQIAGGPPPTCP